MNKVNYDTFIKMLTELNRYISEHYAPDYMLEVRAIGGFSMIVHKRLGEIESPREKSQDIDSLTDDYPQEIIDEIKRIGKEYGANDEDGWLNNHWNQTKQYQEEFAYFIRWKELDSVRLSNIKIYYADMESLFMFKIRAIDDRIALANAEPRQQDVVDAVSILHAYGITDLSRIPNETIRTTIQYFPHAVNYLVDNNMMLGHHISNTSSKQKFEDTEYGKQFIQKVNEYNELENIHTMEQTWKDYFNLPKEDRAGIIWKGEKLRPAVFEDMYLAKCQKYEITPIHEIVNHFWNNCVKHQEYVPKYCKRTEEINKML